MSSQETGKDDCPICLQPVGNNRMNCYQCMTCKQKMHGNCEIEWNHQRKPNNRLLRDDILVCPVCRGDSIAYCYDLTSDMNEDMKTAVQENPNRRGGKGRRGRRTRRGIKGRRTRRGRTRRGRTRRTRKS